MDITSSPDILLTTLTRHREETIARCLAAVDHTSQRLVFSHSTALLLLGAELPARIERDAREELHVCCATRGSRPSLDSLIPHAWAQTMNIQVPYNGLECVGPITAWAQLATELTLEELVVLGDSLMRRDKRLRLVSIADFEDYLANAGKFRSKDKCKLAIRLMREDTDSSRETQTRLLIVRHGLPCPCVNVAIQTDHGILHPDMSYPDLLIAVEYQGFQHDTDEYQIRLDRGRRDYLRSHGWLWLEPDNRIFVDKKCTESFINNLAAILSQRLDVELEPTPIMTLRDAADARKHHNRRNAALQL